MNGDTQERHLMRVLAALDWGGVRSPASGTAPREQPDVLAGREGFILVGELKSGGPPRNPEDVEVRDLRRVGDAFMATTVLVARWKGERAFYFALPGDVDRTPSGHYSIPSDPDRWDWGARVCYGFEDADDGDGGQDVVVDAVDVREYPGIDDWPGDDVGPEDLFMRWVADMGVRQEERAAKS